MNEHSLDIAFCQSQKFTHMAFLHQSRPLNIPLIWNRLLMPLEFFPTSEQLPSYVHLKVSMAISDKLVLLNEEDKTKAYFLNERGEIGYINFLVIHSKKLISDSGQCYLTMDIVLGNDIIFDSLNYQFFKEKEYCFFNEHYENGEFGFDYINQVILIHQEVHPSNKVILHFLTNQIGVISQYCHMDSVEQKIKYQDFSLQLEHGYHPKLV